jgi:hypothetical protein
MTHVEHAGIDTRHWPAPTGTKPDARPVTLTPIPAGTGRAPPFCADARRWMGGCRKTSCHISPQQSHGHMYRNRPGSPPPTLMLPTPTDPRTTGGWTTVPHRNSIHRQTTLPFKPTTQGQLTTGQGPSASQRQVSPATHPNRIGLGPTTRWGETDNNTGQSLPVHN